MSLNECEARISKNPVVDAIAAGPSVNPLIREATVVSLIACKKCNISKPLTEKGFGSMGLDDAMINSEEALRKFRQINCPIRAKGRNYGHS